MPSYAVKGCKSWNMKEGLQRNIRFFTFPKDEDVRELWVMACNRSKVNWLHARIGSLHFTEDDWCLKDKLLNTDRAKCMLDKKAIPSQNLPADIPLAKINEMNKTRFDDTEKPKKTLTLNEKIVAILRYEVDPVYKSVAQHFSCCPSEIRQIIQKKDEILKKWDNLAKKFEVTLSRKRNTISFLSIALYEWIRRTLYYSDFKLTDAIIQMMAIEFKNALNLPNFFPDQAWVDNFRKTYNLRYGSTKKLSIRYQESMSVQIEDILIYLDGIGGSSKAFPETAISALLPSVNYTETAALATEHKYAGSFCAPSTSAAALSGRSNTTPAPSTIEKEPLHIKAEPEDAVSTDHKVITLKEAKYYVKQLEEYALMRENFRLIGLVERLEEALKEEM